MAHSHPILRFSHPQCWCSGGGFAKGSCKLLLPQEAVPAPLPMVTARHKVYCSSPSWEASSCSRELPHSAEHPQGPAGLPRVGGFTPQ